MATATCAATGPDGAASAGFRHMHGGRGGRGRVFDQGDLRFVLLGLIAEKPRHGYEIIKEIEDRLGGAYSPSPGVIYPTLTLLEELGYASVTEDGGKKLYAITPEGEAALAANKAAVDAHLRPHRPRFVPPMAAARRRRSCGRCRICASRLRMRLSRGPLSGCADRRGHVARSMPRRRRVERS